MRTNKLLLAAAALAAGAVTASAQVYSANVVGYINITLKPGYNLIANQLTNGNNNVNIVLTNLPASMDNSTINAFDNATQNFTPAQTWYNGVGWVDPDFNSSSLTITPGKGYFLNNAGAQVTVTLIGEVPQGTTATPIGTGLGMYASVPPVVSGFTTNGFPGTDNMTYQLFDATIQNYTQALTYFAGVGWVDGDFNTVDPAPPVGSGFLISNPGAAGTWTRNFVVN